MNPESKIKKELFTRCEEDTEKRITAIEDILKTIEEARNNETKNSLGDKYETGRAMLQIEEENSKTQLFQAIRVRNQLLKINLHKKSKKVELGSLVTTTQASYYISIGIGKVTVENKDYFCISPGSPIGVILMDKKVGDEFEFNGTSIRIKVIQSVVLNYGQL